MNTLAPVEEKILSPKANGLSFLILSTVESSSLPNANHQHLTDLAA